MLKKIVLSGAAFVLALVCAGTASAADTIGVIDSQGIMSKHPSFEDAIKQVQQVSRQKENEARSASEKESDSAKKAQVIQAKRMELAREEQRLMEPIFRDCQEAVRVVAKKKNITLVLEKASVYFGGADITEDVIQQVRLKFAADR